MTLCNYSTGALPAEEQKLLFIENMFWDSTEAEVYKNKGRRSVPKLLYNRNFKPEAELDFILTQFNTRIEHWIPAVADLKKKCIFVVDSLGNEADRASAKEGKASIDNHVKCFANYLSGAGFGEFEYEQQSNTNFQPDSHSCGPFTAQYFIECASR